MELSPHELAADSDGEAPVPTLLVAFVFGIAAFAFNIVTFASRGGTFASRGRAFTFSGGSFVITSACPLKAGRPLSLIDKSEFP